MSSEQDFRDSRRGRRWDYLRSQVDANKIKESDDLVAQLGREGWEMVSVVFTTSYVHFWFKREAR